MKKALTRKKVIYYFEDGKKIERAPEAVTGNLTGVRGNLSDIRGNLSGIRGDLTGVWGDLTGVRGDLDDCGLTKEDRKKGVNIEDLIK